MPLPVAATMCRRNSTLSAALARTGSGWRAPMVRPVSSSCASGSSAEGRLRKLHVRRLTPTSPTAPPQPKPSANGTPASPRTPRSARGATISSRRTSARGRPTVRARGASGTRAVGTPAPGRGARSPAGARRPIGRRCRRWWILPGPAPTGPAMPITCAPPWSRAVPAMRELRGITAALAVRGLWRGRRMWWDPHPCLCPTTPVWCRNMPRTARGMRSTWSEESWVRTVLALT
mmetsp:Transcript_93294/g.213281  ORF Transcript_93294/g.213281 Transcript_93294/m.213281 type:complete len:233 (+) Transcript_93294:2108-2806(+)